MTVWHTYYHLVWATYNRQPLINDCLEAVLYQYFHGKTKSLEAPLYAIGGVADHIHLIIAIPPKYAIAKFVGQLKGGSSHQINQTFPDQKFGWQKEYGVFSLGRKQLERAVAYVEHQKQHHADRATLIRSLEPEIFDRSSHHPPRS
jgi:putative transposase